MCLQEFIDLVTSTQVIDDNFGVREINTIFRVSISTQVDEIRSDRHTRMMFLEFVEAVARIADRVVQFLVAGGERHQLGTAQTGLSGTSGINLGAFNPPGTADQLEQIEEELNIEDRGSDGDLSTGRISLGSVSDGKTNDVKEKDPFVKNEISSMANQTPRGFKPSKTKRKRDIKNNTTAYNNTIGMDNKL